MKLLHARDLAGTAGVRRPRAARPRRRRETKNKEGRRTGGTAKEAPNVLCRFMSARARYHQSMSLVPATDSEDLEVRPYRLDSEGVHGHCNQVRQVWYRRSKD